MQTLTFFRLLPFPLALSRFRLRRTRPLPVLSPALERDIGLDHPDMRHLGGYEEYRDFLARHMGPPLR